MSRIAAGTLLAMALALPLVHAQSTSQSPQDPQFRAGVNTVSVYATVLDADGHLVPHLRRDDFTVFDDGRPQTITQFANTVQPITVVLMMDRSVSLEPRFPLERAAGEAFVASMTPGDRARIGSFNGTIRIDPDTFTGNRDELIRILNLNLLDAGLTPLWNATASAMNALAKEPGRRVVLLFSDGDNNPGLPGRKTVTFDQVRDRAQAEDVMVYSIGLNDGCEGMSTGAPLAQRGIPPPGGGPDNGGKPVSTTPRPFPAGAGTNPGGAPIGGVGGPGVNIPIGRIFGNGMGEHRCANARPRPQLKDLAADGGGGYVELHSNDDLGAIFERLADELHHQYLLGFTIAKADGRSHVLDVRPRDPNLTVRARRGYLAAAK
jgi:VWFA-related protein